MNHRTSKKRQETFSRIFFDDLNEYDYENTIKSLNCIKRLTFECIMTNFDFRMISNYMKMLLEIELIHTSIVRPHHIPNIVTTKELRIHT